VRSAQLIVRKGCSARALSRWMALATSSFPVPDLAADQHGNVDRRHPFDPLEQGAHRRTVADDPVKRGEVGVRHLGSAPPSSKRSSAGPTALDRRGPMNPRRVAHGATRQRSSQLHRLAPRHLAAHRRDRAIASRSVHRRFHAAPVNSRLDLAGRHVASLRNRGDVVLRAGKGHGPCQRATLAKASTCVLREARDGEATDIGCWSTLHGRR